MNKNKATRKRLAGCLASILCLIAGAATAGEITGNGKPITVHGKSECAYSGQQDDPVEDEGFFRGDRVQSWGQIPKAARDFLRSIGVYPGRSCNPKKADD